MSKALQAFIAAITRTLDKAFGYEIYIDEIEQGFQEPCFFIELIQAQKERINNMRYKFTLNIHVSFFPKENPDQLDDIINMAQKLYSIFEVIRGTDVKYRCFGLTHRVVGNVLHFTFSVIIHESEYKQVAPMKRLQQKITTRREDN